MTPARAAGRTRRAFELAAGPLLLGAAAYAVGSVAIFAIAAGLAVVYVGAHVSVARARAEMVATREIDVSEVLEGEELRVALRLPDLGSLPVGIEIPTAAGRWTRLGPGRTTLDWRIERPGRFRIDPLPLRVRDDLGLTHVHASAGEPVEVLVLPRPDRRSAAAHGARATPQDDPEPDGLRAYTPGTPLRRIDWRSAARGAELQARAVVPATGELPLLVVDPSGARDPAALDDLARRAAGDALELLRAGGCRVALPGMRRPVELRSIHDWPAVHRALAELDPSVGPPALAPGDRVHRRLRATVTAERADVPELPPGVVATGWTG